jgi:hypothetical protein
MKQDFIDFPEKDVFAAFVGERFVGIYKKVKEGEILARPEFVFN